jgi:AAHS family 4-hydroxybenzoate transporter-like MFS transporter
VATSFRDVVDDREIDGVDLQLSSYSAPVLMTEWALGKSQFAPLLAAALIGSAVGTLIGSWMGDRFGRKPTLTASVAFFGLMTLLCATAETPRQFMAFRFASGLGFGAVFPVATAMMSEWMPRRAAGKAISVMTVGIPVGGMIGAAAAARFLPTYGWRVLFNGTGSICLLLAGVLLWRLPESPSFLLLRRRLDSAGALLARAWNRPLDFDVKLLPVESRATGSAGLFTQSNLRVNVGLWLGVLSITFAAYAIGGWLTVILVDLHLPLATALRGPLLVSACGVIGALTIGWILARIGTRTVMPMLSILAFVAAALIIVAADYLAPGKQFLTVLFVGLAISGFCSGALLPTFYVVAANAYETSIRSRGVGVAAVSGRIGAILSSFAGGAALAMGHTSGFFMLIAVLAFAALSGSLLIDRHVQPFRTTDIPSGQSRTPGTH